MRSWIRIFILASMLAPSVATSFAEERATASGMVVDPNGKPLENAAVIVHSAAVKKGYSVFCPTCYKDCGKRTVTGPDGSYSIGGLDPELVFTLVAVKDGYLAAYIWNVNPAAGPARNATLKPRPAIKDASQVVRGRIVDTQGNPQPGAVVQSDMAVYSGPGGQIRFSSAVDWINELTVTNDQGEFELAYSAPALEMTFTVIARGMAPKHFTASTGGEQKNFIVAAGATIRGRLVYGGAPVPNAEVGLVPYDSSTGRWYREVRIGTEENGTFAITNVPPGRIWVLHPTMESLASRGIGSDPIDCETKDDGQDVNLGDIRLMRAHALRGRVVLGDGKFVPPNMRVTLTTHRFWDSQVMMLASDGSFRFDGLPEGVYSVLPAVRGYRLPDDCAILCRSAEVIVKKDVSDFVIKMVPEAVPLPQVQPIF